MKDSVEDLVDNSGIIVFKKEIYFTLMSDLRHFLFFLFY